MSRFRERVFAEHHLQVALLLRRIVDDAGYDRLDISLDRCHWRPQLMRYIVEQPPSHVLQPAQLLIAFLEQLVRPGQLDGALLDARFQADIELRQLPVQLRQLLGAAPHLLCRPLHQDERMRPAHQLIAVHRLGNIIIGPRIEGRHDRFLAYGGGHDQNRQFIEGISSAYDSAEIVTRQPAWQHQIEDDQIITA